MCFTVEPGIYFNEILIEDAKENYEKYLDIKLINRYKSVIGGVRIEDDLCIDLEGKLVNFTDCPRTVV